MGLQLYIKHAPQRSGGLVFLVDSLSRKTSVVFHKNDYVVLGQQCQNDGVRWIETHQPGSGSKSVCHESRGLRFQFSFSPQTSADRAALPREVLRRSPRSKTSVAGRPDWSSFKRVRARLDLREIARVPFA